MLLKPNQMRLLIRVAETGKLQAAADAMGMSQPAASRMLSDLERTAGGPMFRRHPKGMELTEVGGIFVRRARAILAEFDALETEVTDVRDGRVGTVRVGSVTGPAAGTLVPALRNVRATAPNIEPTVEVGTSADLFRGLEEDRFDFILARPPADYDTRHFRLLPARSEVVTLVVHRGHPLLGRRGLGLADMADYEWIIQQRGNPIRSAVENAFHMAGIPIPGMITSSSSLLVMLALIENSTAIAPQSHEVAQLLIRSSLNVALEALDLRQQISVTPYFIIHHRDHEFSQAARKVMQEVMARL
ncbi:LysR family transcriptional regulator [Sulfitobacter sp. D35]|uniref:LysR family transcriptional regulator n=1 Tax=Sulfitobacter sp. D35 TaxID=3083252 RepID=UPI00296EEDCF|nr:LysR family transcriptional regulator [Sulfitobacter sp. D35]MDW4498932.1 LysR family transcriptional regulator [Sulfitobacter sp. D35]